MEEKCEYRLETQLGEFTGMSEEMMLLAKDPRIQVWRMEIIHRDEQGRIIGREPWDCNEVEED